MNRFYTKKIALAMALMLMGSMLVSCNSSDGNSEDSSNTVDVTSENSNEEVVTTTTQSLQEGEIVEGALNTEVSNEDIAITIKNTYKIDMNSSDDYQYVGVYVEIVNNSDQDQEFNYATSFGVRESGSNEDNPSLIGSHALVYIKQYTDFNILRGTVAPGTMIDGIVVISIPKDQTEVTLVFYPNILETTSEIQFTITTDELEELPLK